MDAFRTRAAQGERFRRSSDGARFTARLSGLKPVQLAMPPAEAIRSRARDGWVIAVPIRGGASGSSDDAFASG